LLHDEFALLDEGLWHVGPFRDVHDEKLQHVSQRLYEVVQVVPKFIYEERLDYLIVEQDAFRETRSC